MVGDWEVSAAKAGGVAFAGLLLGTLLGSGVQAWLRVDLVPIGVSLLSFSL